MEKPSYKEIFNFDISEYRLAFYFENSSNAILSVALEPWAGVVILGIDESIEIYLPKDSSDSIEFVEGDASERYIGAKAEKMCVKINEKVVAVLPENFPVVENKTEKKGNN